MSRIASSCVVERLSGAMFPFIMWAPLLPSRGLGTYGRLVVTHLDWQFSEAFLVDQACDVAMVFAATTSGSIAPRITMTVIAVTGHGCTPLDFRAFNSFDSTNRPM